MTTENTKLSSVVMGMLATANTIALALGIYFTIATTMPV